MVTNSKICQTAGPIGTKFGLHVQIHLGMDIRQTNCPSRHKGSTWGVLGGQTFKSLEKLSTQTAGPIGTNFGSCLRIHLGMDIYAKYKSPRNTPGSIGGGGLRGHKFKCLGICQTARPIGTKFGT